MPWLWHPSSASVSTAVVKIDFSGHHSSSYIKDYIAFGLAVAVDFHLLLNLIEEEKEAWQRCISVQTADNKTKDKNSPPETPGVGVQNHQNKR